MTKQELIDILGDRHPLYPKSYIDDAIQKGLKEMSIIDEPCMYPRVPYNACYGYMKGWFSIQKVIFNEPATIILWSDGTKTVVKCENEPFDPEKGMAMAIAKKAFGNEGNYYNNFTKWLPKPEEKDGETLFDEALERLREAFKE